MILYATATAQAVFPGTAADCRLESLPHGYAQVSREGRKAGFAGSFPPTRPTT